MAEKKKRKNLFMGDYLMGPLLLKMGPSAQGAQQGMGQVYHLSVRDGKG